MKSSFPFIVVELWMDTNTDLMKLLRASYGVDVMIVMEDCKPGSQKPDASSGEDMEFRGG